MTNFGPNPCTWDSWARIPREEHQKRMSAYLRGEGELWTECDKAAVFLVGSRETWHLCEEHAEDPVFKRMKKVERWSENRRNDA